MVYYATTFGLVAAARCRPLPGPRSTCRSSQAVPSSTWCRKLCSFSCSTCCWTAHHRPSSLRTSEPLFLRVSEPLCDIACPIPPAGGVVYIASVLMCLSCAAPCCPFGEESLLYCHKRHRKVKCQGKDKSTSEVERTDKKVVIHCLQPIRGTEAT